MATYSLQATIRLKGGSLRSKKDVLDHLVMMLGCYEDMDDSDVEITITPQSVTKEN